MTGIERAFREEWGAVLATLVRQLGDFQLAEDALADAFAVAVVAWERDGVPERPGAWITTTARRKAIDRLRRDRVLADRIERLRLEAERAGPAETEESTVVDDRLRLMFTCCHPALALEARVALTLKMLGGLTTAEIARAFLVSEPAMAQRLVRAKKKIVQARIPYRVPRDDVLPDRVSGVLAVLYLVFNEGYQAAAGDRLAREEVAREAIRLTRLLTELMPDEPEALGLMALMLLHDARAAARTDEQGRYIPLDQQDRERWDQDAISTGLHTLDRALRLRRPGPYQLQAAIAALHVDPRGPDWPQIADIYGALARMAPSPVVEVNRAVAVAFADGPTAGLATLAPLLAEPALRDYQPLHAAHAELLMRSGQNEAAAGAYRRAIDLSANAVEKLELERRLHTLVQNL